MAAPVAVGIGAHSTLENRRVESRDATLGYVNRSPGPVNSPLYL